MQETWVRSLGWEYTLEKGKATPLPFGERTRDCTPGNAGKEGPQLARTGASQGFPRAAAPVGPPIKHPAFLFTKKFPSAVYRTHSFEGFR